MTLLNKRILGGIYEEKITLSSPVIHLGFYRRL